MMSRVEQRVAIGCPQSPRTVCTALIEGGGGVSRWAPAHSKGYVITRLIRHPPTRTRRFLLSSITEWTNK